MRGMPDTPTTGRSPTSRPVWMRGSDAPSACCVPGGNAAKRGAAPWVRADAPGGGKETPSGTWAARLTTGRNPKVAGPVFPRFKRRSGRQSFRLDNGPDTVRIEGRCLRAGKLGNIFACARALRFEGRIVGAVVSRTAQRWFVSVTVEDGIDVPTGYEPVGAHRR